MFGASSAARQTGFIALTADYPPTPCSSACRTRSISLVAHYTIEWAMSGVRYRVDGSLAHFAGQRTEPWPLKAGRHAVQAFSDRRPDAADVWIDNNMPQVTFGGYSIQREQ
jgi:hypothetical protein